MATSEANCGDLWLVPRRYQSPIVFCLQLLARLSPGEFHCTKHFDLSTGRRLSLPGPKRPPSASIRRRVPIQFGGTY